jgi:hypothetical protein
MILFVVGVVAIVLGCCWLIASERRIWTHVSEDFLARYTYTPAGRRLGGGINVDVDYNAHIRLNQVWVKLAEIETRLSDMEKRLAALVESQRQLRAIQESRAAEEMQK